MSIFSKLLSVCVATGLFCSSAQAFSTRPDIWAYYYFDGSGFKAGQSPDGGAFIALHDQVQPVVLLKHEKGIDSPKLPRESGVIAGICYFQSSGGKLGNSAAYLPCPETPLQISAGGRQFKTVKTDEHGYFVVVLPAGKYSIGSVPFTADISVESGVTTLVPLRAGKRMVD